MAAQIVTGESNGTRLRIPKSEEKKLEFDRVPCADLLVVVRVDEVDLERGQVLQDHILRAERAMEDPLILILLAKAERFPG